MVIKRQNGIWELEEITEHVNGIGQLNSKKGL